MSGPPHLELAIVAPSLEAGNVPILLNRLAEALADIHYEVIFVDDDSPDGAAELIRIIAQTDARVRVIQRLNRRGSTSACIEGILSTAAPYVAVMDSVRYDERILPEMLRTLEAKNLDIVIGRRQDVKVGRRFLWPLLRCRIQDPFSGFFVMRREFFMENAHRASGIGSRLLLDLLSSARAPARVAEIDCRTSRSGPSGDQLGIDLECLQLLLDRLVGNVIPPSFLLFALVGIAGLAVYFSVFVVALFGWRTSFDVAQFSAALAAMTVNFFLNNAVTFRSERLRGHSILRGLISFYAACAIGTWINVKMAHAAGALGAQWYTAGLLGLGLGSVWNYAVSKLFTWRNGRKYLGRKPSVPRCSSDLLSLAARLNTAQRIVQEDRINSAHYPSG